MIVSSLDSQSWLGNTIKVGYTLSSVQNPSIKEFLQDMHDWNLVGVVRTLWAGECSYTHRISEERNFKKMENTFIPLL